jgi:hypothetical protein
MSPVAGTSSFRFGVAEWLLDAFAFLFVYFVPALSGLLGIPLYLVEPMRLALILSLLHTSRLNAYILALSLPIFSLVALNHPSVLKTLLMCAELCLNVWLFLFIARKTSNGFLAGLFSILASKLVYYLLKWALISLALLDTELFSTPLLPQLITTVIFSGYASIIFLRREVIALRQRSNGQHQHLSDLT